MDALQISGKWYISAKRAAKEHGYHTDYIGQLVRTGKVKGQKVGRTWYVLTDSLEEYLSSERKSETKGEKKSKKKAVLPAPEIIVESESEKKVEEEEKPEPEIQKPQLPRMPIKVSTEHHPSFASKSMQKQESASLQPKEHKLLVYLKDEEAHPFNEKIEVPAPVETESKDEVKETNFTVETQASKPEPIERKQEPVSLDRAVHFSAERNYRKGGMGKYIGLALLCAGVFGGVLAASLYLPLTIATTF